MTKITILNDGYKLSTGPNGNVHLTVKRKPHLCYSIEVAQQLGFILVSTQPV